jgi:hypothetical protein
MEGTDNTLQNIQPQTITKTHTISCFKVSVISHELFSNITLAVTMFDANGTVLDVQSMNISGSDYAAYINETALMNKVTQTFGFTLCNDTTQ